MLTQPHLKTNDKHETEMSKHKDLYKWWPYKEYSRVVTANPRMLEIEGVM